ncbi:MAG: S9 family peptidase [Verrucomicrobia bacterium]|nr:S9 family peptidase [Cytophagales bacterium]
MKMKHLLCLVLCTSVFFAGKAQQKPVNQMPVTYPKTEKVSQTDDYFGTKVADPYRWLEDDNSAQTAAWVDAQNQVTFDYLSKIPFRQKIKDRLTEIANYPKYGSPFRLNEFYLFSKNDGLQNQYVTYIQKGLNGTPEVFLDPNKLSADGTVTANISSVSHDKKYLTYNSAKSGSDWQEMYVMEVATKKQLTDKLEWVKFSGAAWLKDGFFYSKYDEPKKGTEFSGASEFQKIYFHKLGDPQSQDQLIFEDRDHTKRYFGTATTEDERFLFLSISEGTDGNEVYYKDLQAGDAAFKPLFKGFNNNFSIIDNIGGKLLVYHNLNAPNYKLSLLDPKNPAQMTDFIAEKTEKLEDINTGGGKLFASYLKDVNTKVFQYDMATGKMEREIKFPTLGSAGGFSGNKDDKFLFYTFTSFTYPPTIYKYDIATGKSVIFRKSEVKFDPEAYETKQVFATSKDGTKIPMFITYKKGLVLNGNNPTLLYAYGGFNISLTPGFSAFNIPLLENGGVYVMANLRGGGEYGEKWHKSGMLLKKQNVFDDFIACGEYLIKANYTSNQKLALQGGSNGGLLVGAVMAQRPDLAKVAFPAVGVMDMLRYHKFTVGWGWAVEYGSADSSQTSFKNLYAYSPLHNLKDGVSYPATMVTTADHDDRVVPAHSFKFAATLQEKHKGNNPVLIRIDKKAGHGGGKPLSKQIEERADIWAFMFYNLGIEPYQK